MRKVCHFVQVAVVCFQRVALRITRHGVSVLLGENRRFFNVEPRGGVAADVHPILHSAALDKTRRNYKRILCRAARGARLRLCGLFVNPGNGNRLMVAGRQEFVPGTIYRAPTKKRQRRGGWAAGSQGSLPGVAVLRTYENRTHGAGGLGDYSEGGLGWGGRRGDGACGKRGFAACVFC